MTLSARNYYLGACAVFSFLVLSAFVFLAYKAAPFFPAAAQTTDRPVMPSFMQKLPPHPYAPLFAASASVFYAALAQILIFLFFEKTQSPEILFFTFFTFSFTFELARLMVPLRECYAFPQFFVMASERFEMFGRCFGIFSIFASSVYAAGLKAQRQGTILFAAFIAALMIALKTPVDSSSWDTSLRPDSGFRSTLEVLDGVLMALTIAGFFVAARIRGNKEFQLIGAGVFLALLGRFFLLDADTLIFPIPAVLLLAAGTWLSTRQLRRIYLWI